ncbi:YcdB/YcdC domain-containing protein [Paenibacillus macerans]|uniref:YcdB/YcdC domain-containing protein n=1 Tax=Paenibacillus macerans TaxID=44252 RepID=UPI00068EAF17|nr:YcdB/YcdC domain-containing protein [Paenibacillus macerans]MCY7559910.1 hypothetical protein [Paenibacillus macerans]MEC0151450.1 hypothetical protein [Paenibacillus macerans]GBK61189.1 hypothetical protein PbDSM24746_11930 [Paenibacillus macerans]GBK67492.1 hypothetical protein PbJCM17693_12000 [Paenibacillus macerans]GIP09116.1 hypothetical protein J1TS5_12860 [Paenibacillus macerans]
MVIQSDTSPRKEKSKPNISHEVTIPDGYVLKTVQGQKQNAEDVWWFRYEKASGANHGPGGEHFSFVITKSSNKLLGFTWMDKTLAEGELPTKEAAKASAQQFLGMLEPGLFAKLDNLWIDKHDESTLVKNGKAITFEQEIKWVNGRVTEKWLHDSWVRDRS